MRTVRITRVGACIRLTVGIVMTAGIVAAALFAASTHADEQPSSGTRVYRNTLKRIENPKPILADHPQYIAPVDEPLRYEAPILVDDSDGELHVRAWRFSYNARGIIEVPNRLKASETAIMMVHPWGIDDENGWMTPEPAGVVDFGTPERNHFSSEHTKSIVDPFLASLRGKVAFVMYSLPGTEDALRKRVYRSVRSRPDPADRAAGEAALRQRLKAFRYVAQPVIDEFAVSRDLPVRDYFRQFQGTDATARYNGEGFWSLPIPICTSIKYDSEDVVIYDEEGYDVLRDFLKEHGVRHVLLTGYCTDMCFARTTAGYENLSKDFNVFLVGDATLATYPSNTTPAHATNASISYAALQQLVTQVSWIKYDPADKPADKEDNAEPKTEAGE